MMHTTGPLRWHAQRWLIDEAIGSRGTKFDQNRLRYSLGPVRDETSAADIGILSSSITKLGGLTLAASLHARRHEDLAHRIEDRGHPATAGVHWFAAEQLWLLAAWPLWETTDELVELHRSKTAAFSRWTTVADHTVEAVNIPALGGALPAYLHLPTTTVGPHPVVIASDGMDGGRESLVNRIGDGISFGSSFMSLVAATHPQDQGLRGRAALLVALTDGTYAISRIHWLTSLDRVGLVTRNHATRGGRSLSWDELIVFTFVDGRKKQISHFSGDQYGVDELLAFREEASA